MLNRKSRSLRKKLKSEIALTKLGAAVSSKPPVGYIDVRVFAHATEDPEKVLAAVRNLLPDELSEEVVFQKTQLTGHHGNPISLFEAKLEDKQVLPAVLNKLGAGLTSLDKEQLDREMRLHVEKRNLYLRFDKQLAFKGEVRFSQNDPIHVKIHFKNKTFEEINAICRETGLLP
jgi:RNA binding exosome subunit